jgi:hypothetical protein
MKLTREQAAIISAYTGMLAGPFEDMHGYAEKVLGHPVWTHQFADKELNDRLVAAAKDDFIALCANRDDQAPPSAGEPK